jgi:hypothetical protein
MVGGSGHKVIQGLAGLAAGHGDGCVVLHAEQEISQGRPVRNYQPIAPFVSIGGREYCGRSWTRKFGELCAVHAHRSRFLKGNRDPHHFGGQAGTREQSRIESGACSMRRNRKDAPLPHPRDSGKEMNRLIPIRYSLLPIRSFGVTQ